MKATVCDCSYPYAFTKLLIFDEPTVALDPAIRHQLWRYLKQLRNAGTSILLTTHYLDEAEELSERKN